MDSTYGDSPILSFRETYALHQMQHQWDFEREMLELMDKSPAYKDYYGAALEARRSVHAEELVAELNERYKVEHSIRQGVKAACLAREDVKKISSVQLHLLERLDRLHSLQVGTIERLNLMLQEQRVFKRFAWICTGLLVYIALQLS